MKFEAKNAGLLRGLAPVVEVATKGALKDFEQAGKVKLSVEGDSLVATSWNGRLSIWNNLSSLTIDDIGLVPSEEGTFVVNAIDMMKILSSFRPSDQLTIVSEEKSGGKELKFVLCDDPEQFQTLPCYEDDIDAPVATEDFSRKISIRRDAFLRGYEKTFFAIGYERRRPRYLHWVLKTKEDGLRFVAGTGARFAVIDMDGKNVFKELPEEETTFMFPKDPSPVLSKILTSVDDEYIDIGLASDNAASQIVISAGYSKIVLLGLDPNETYIDENVVLNADYTEKFVTEVSEWEYAGKGTIATFDEQLKKESRPHTATVNVDFQKKDLFIQTEERMKSKRKIPIIDSDNKVDNVSFQVSSLFLSELAQHAENSKYIQLEYAPAIDDKNRRPIVARFFANETIVDPSEMVNDNKNTGAKERFVIFFAQHQG